MKERLNPLEIGRAGGQQYDVAAAIRSFLQQMAEGNIDLGAAVIKELLQNADDANATEVGVILDERSIPTIDDSRFAPIQVPSLLVRNNKPFTQKDFAALLEVGKGHKLSNPTAAGRFGIGFNSVCFLTDTPLLFSQREVHLFDLLHSVVEKNGWIFSLDDFHRGEGVGPIKSVIERAFPKVALGSGRSFADLAHSGAYYQQTLITLPLRQWDGEQGTPLYQKSYRNPGARMQLLDSMWEEAIRSLLFLKCVERLTFSILRDSGLEEWGQVAISQPPEEFKSFLTEIEEIDERRVGRSLTCGFFERTITYCHKSSPKANRSFLIRHVAPFTNPDIAECRERLRKNKERAIPWAAIAIPKDLDSLNFASEAPPWRVFLPVIELGPCSCILHAALFVGPSRQRIEYRTDESDEAQRKTRWNQLLVEHALVPLLRDADLNELIPEFLTNYPKEVLALIPEAQENAKDQNLGDYFKRVFHEGPWELRLKDLWDISFSLLVNDPETTTVLEMIPEWFARYRDKCAVYSSSRRRFVTWRLGEVLRDRLATTKGVIVRREIQEDIVLCVLTAEAPPSPEHLKRLLESLSESTFTPEGLQGLWAFQELNGNPIKFLKTELYLVPGPEEASAIHSSLRSLKLDFENVSWIDPDIGLPTVKQPSWVTNLKQADANAALELLRRVGSANRHDQFSTHRQLTPVIDFLCSQDPSWLPRDMRLAFLVKTATNQHLLRKSGAIFLRSEHPAEEELTLWDGLLRGAFAEVDPAFSPQLRRLLEHAPGLRESLDVPGCRFELVGSTVVLEFLHRSRLENPDCIVLIGQGLRKRLQLRTNAESRRLAYRAARTLVEEADRSWGALDSDQRHTVLCLPIHRTADGDLLALITADASEVVALDKQFWLQSDEDLQDAPIKLPDRQILHSEDPGLNRFYRDRLGIRPKDRFTLVCECLRQVGTDGVDSFALLKYIAECFDKTIEKLEKEGSRDALADVQELRNLLRESKSVPCVDNVWRTASDCKSGWSLARELRVQGWTAAQANELTEKVTYPGPLATLDANLTRLVRQLHNIDVISSGNLALLSATSESSDFKLGERAKIINDNLRPTTSKLLQRAKVLEELACDSLGGKTEFRSLVLLPSEPATFSSSLVECPFPEAAHLAKLGTSWGLEQKSVRGVLAYLGVPVLTISQVVHGAVKATAGVQPATRQAAWEVLVHWLGKVTELDGVSVVDALRDQPWVLARKGLSFEFRKASDVLYRAEAGEILDKQFWVIAGSLPAPLTNFRNKLGFLDLPTDSETVGKLALCLAQSRSASTRASMDVYRLVARIIRSADPTVRQTWIEAANASTVYRLFRSPEAWTTEETLYVGTDELRRDFGDQLRCVSALKDLDPDVLQLYRDLGVSDTPTLAQTLAALSRINGSRESLRLVHDGLVSLFQDRLRAAADSPISVEQAACVRVLTLSGEYAALSVCYRYPLVTKAEQLDGPSQNLIIDEQDPPTKKLLNLLREYAPGAIVVLTDVATAEPVEFDGVSPSENSVLILAPWEQWLAELAEKDSEVHTKLREYLSDGFVSNLSLHIVSRIVVNYRLPSGRTVTQSPKWKGPASFGDASGKIFVRGDLLEQDFVTSQKKLDDLDSVLAQQLGRLLCQAQADEISKLALDTLERPRVVFKKLRDRAQDFLLHQYNDQNADADFAALLDDYFRTTKGTEKRAQLEKQLFERVHENFVPARREQIRAYGYDQFSVFAELLQNAEDAYIQSETLGLARPDPAYIRFSFLKQTSGEEVLRVEHAGRPFNCYRHGSRKEETYKKDVEGVLRSAGSFKPQSQLQHAELKTIGKFGLGFKSVLLLTERPRIHSGQWHFEIEAGCMPRQIQRPDDLPSEVTRIDLPLLAGGDLPETNLAERLVSLMPFLQQISQLELTKFNGTKRQLRSRFVPLNTQEESLQIERANICRSEGPQVELLRVRHTAHQGQLAIYLDSEGLPAPWNQAFEWDTFAGLPLRLHLGAGVGVSHHFKIQAGRTHLIALNENQTAFDQLAGLMSGLPSALEGCVSDKHHRGDVLRRFWALWSWDAGDKDAGSLRTTLAKQLLVLAESCSIVPTRDPDRCVALRDGPLFCFHGIPDDFVAQLIAHAVDVSPDAQPVSLRPDNVISHRVHSAIQQTARAAQREGLETPRILAWPELGAVFQSRAWFAEQPQLLGAMARSLSEEDRSRILVWLGTCMFRATDGATCLSSQLLPFTFPGVEHLPSGRMHRLDHRYDTQAVELLKSAGMPAQPTVETLASWLTEGLTTEECVGLLRYLGEENRWKGCYQLRTYLTRPWFTHGAELLTSADAIGCELVPSGLDPVFLAWLGVASGGSEPASPVRRPVDAHAALQAIQEWWRDRRPEAERDYERRTYPEARPPELLLDFSDLQRNRSVRANRLTLFILGCLHTLGRTRPEQHKGFLQNCWDRGWFDVFADPKSSAERWIEILEDYSDEIETESYRPWMLQFVSIFMLSRHLPDYVFAFLEIERHSKMLPLGLITRPRTNPLYQGGGPDAPPASRMLGIGACFVIRELVRLKVLRTKLAYPHCYVPHERVRGVLSHLGWESIDGPDASRHIYEFLVQHLGPEGATFEHCFDLPFQEIAEHPDLQKRFFGGAISG